MKVEIKKWVTITFDDLDSGSFKILVVCKFMEIEYYLKIGVNVLMLSEYFELSTIEIVNMILYCYVILIVEYNCCEIR